MENLSSQGDTPSFTHTIAMWKGLNQLSSTELCDHVTSSLPNTVVTVTQTNIDARHSDGIPRDQLGAAGGGTDGKAVSNSLVRLTICGSLVEATGVIRRS